MQYVVIAGLDCCQIKKKIIYMLNHISYVSPYIQLMRQGSTSTIEAIYHGVCGRVV